MPTTFAQTIDGNEILAKRSQCDYAGADIQTTYATKSEVTTGLASKQDTISDLATIRSGAADGATAVQPGDLATVATTGAYSDLSGTPTIPPALSAGNGIDITNNVVSADLDGTSLTNGANGLSVTLPVPDTTGASQGDVLSVGQNGIEWVTPGGSGGDDAVLTYNVSTWSDFTTAYNAGKNIRVAETVDGATHEAVLFEYNPNGSPYGYAKFTATILRNGVGAVSSNWYQISNTGSGVWTRGAGTIQGNFSGQGAISVNSSSHAISLTLDGSSLTQSSSGLAVANPLPSTLGTAGQVLQVNSGATGVEWATPSGGSVTDVEVDGTSVVSGGVASITMPTELVPAVTSSDDAKVLTATYSGGAGSYSWENPAGLFEAQYGISTYAEIAAAVQAHKDIFCRVSPNSNTSRMAFLAYIGSNNFEFQYYRSNSNASQTDSIFVYTVNSSNTWSTTERTVKAGNIDYPVTDVEVDGASVVSGGVASITMPTGVPSYTTTEDGKVLGVVDNQGTAELEWVAQSAGGTQADWSEADPTAPSYIENKPVPKTLVAGTGITITETANNLTVASTNQLYNAGTGLKLSSATFSLDETVLFYNANGENLKNGITLSESRLNFNRLRITYAIATNAAPAYLEIPMMGVNTGAQFIAVLTAPFDNHAYDVAGYSLIWFTYFVNCTNTYLESATSQFVGKSGFIDGTTTGSWAQGVNNNVPIIYEVVGINRIASN